MLPDARDETTDVTFLFARTRVTCISILSEEAARQTLLGKHHVVGSFHVPTLPTPLLTLDSAERMQILSASAGGTNYVTSDTAHCFLRCVAGSRDG